MQRRYQVIILIMAWVLPACKGQPHPVKPSSFHDTATPFKREIPTYKNGEVDVFYRVAKDKQRQLGLDSLENGFDNLQIRVWYDFSFIRERKLVIISNKDTGWAATVYDLEVKWDGNTETILSKKIRQVIPKSGWAFFSNKLLQLQLLTLPNGADIAGYDTGTDGSDCSVEIATRSRYRFYSYWEPEQFRNEFWQAKKIADMMDLFRQELGVQSPEQ